MKQFFGAFFGSIVGLLITGVLMAVIIGAFIAAGLKGAFDGEGQKTFTVKENSVLHLKIEGPISERGMENPFEELDLGSFMPPTVLGVRGIVKSIEHAKTDDKIKGIYLDIRYIEAGFGTIEEIRNALIDFKKSKKFIYSYSEGYSQKSYYLASTATKLYLNPQGGMELKGLSAQIMFMKNMLDKLGIEMQIFRHGKFKSAIEPFMLDKMSEANRLQTETFMGSIWNSMLDGISKERGISVDKLNELANNLSIDSPESALNAKLVDGILYEDEVMSLLKKDLKLAEKDKIAFAEIGKYQKNIKGSRKEKKMHSKEPKIALIYAVGGISSGEGDEENIGSDRIAKAIRDARLDTTVKAIVLRVNSPGGSALASDVIWREMTLAKKAKPTVVSMGDVAASGGYYISCAADRIFAQPNTITGSIGVFGILPNVQKAFADKLGINIDTVNTNKHSDVGTPFRAVNKDEFSYIQNGVEKVYETFIGRVAEGRKTTTALVDSIGQGRVWSGTDALKINLVDELGGTNDAIAYAAKMAKVTDYKIEELPKRKDPFSMLLGNKEDEMETRLIKKNLGAQYMFLNHVKSIINLKGIQARLPYEITIN
ncbi:MAG TPA: signal peptide peptidase SppA [Bacteroidia bacterium]|jgi:protease-4|nr:signal peptide peptidase SppA [Bacteroidia bacterium]